MRAPMHVDLTGCRALVTGGSSDIGQALCGTLARAGCDVAFTYFSDHEGAEAARALVEGAGRKAQVIRANFREGTAATDVVQALAEGMGPVEILVHNAASGILRDVQDLKDRHWEWCMAVNATSLFALAARMLPARGAGDEEAPPLLKDGGRIVALSSLGASRAIPQYAAIGASKAALESLVRHLSLETGARGITVNGIAPGIVETRALEHFPHKETLLDVARQRTALGRLVTPHDVAQVLLFLCSEAGAMVHGQILHVDGGYAVVA